MIIVRQEITENLRNIQPAPGVQMQELPGDLYSFEGDEDKEDPDIRGSVGERDKHPAHDLHDDGYTSIYLPEPFVEKKNVGVVVGSGPSTQVLEVPDTYSDPSHYTRSNVPINH